MFNATAHFYHNSTRNSAIVSRSRVQRLGNGGLTAAQYYNAGVQAAMDDFKLYPNATAIPLATETSHLAQPSVV